MLRASTRGEPSGHHLAGIHRPGRVERGLDRAHEVELRRALRGRDRSIASLDALVAIREAIGPEPTVLLDSGIRSGADVFVALALGADAVLLGRPHVYGLAIDGAKGVSALIDNVVAELDLTMGLVGAASVADITRDLLLPAP